MKRKNLRAFDPFSVQTNHSFFLLKLIQSDCTPDCRGSGEVDLREVMLPDTLRYLCHDEFCNF